MLNDKLMIIMFGPPSFIRRDEVDRYGKNAAEHGIKLIKLQPNLHNGDYLFNYHEKIEDHDLPHAAFLLRDVPSMNEISLLRDMEMRGVKLLNSPYCQFTASNKLLVYPELQNLGIPTPRTMGVNISSFNNQYSVVESIIRRIGLPCVLKPANLATGIGVVKADSIEQLEDFISMILASRLTNNLGYTADQYWIAQEYIKESKGRTVRVFILNGRCLGGVLRESNNWKIGRDGRSSVKLRYDPPKYLVDTSITVCNNLNLNYAAIDFLFGPDDQFLIGEVSPAPGLDYIHDLYPELDMTLEIMKYLMPHKF